MPIESIPDVRPLSSDEAELVAWLVARAGKPAELVAQLPELRVEKRCGCGCASVDFSVSGRIPPRGSGMVQVGPDCFWGTPEEGLFSVFLFQVEGILAGLEVYSVDGKVTPTALPAAGSLRLQP